MSPRAAIMVAVGTYLDDILLWHRRRASADRRDQRELVEAARLVPGPRGFRSALRADPNLSVIAEIKRRSPSKGTLKSELDPAAVASQYATGGAACLSVLTDAEHFGGSAEDLRAARSVAGLPVIRKDFTIDPRDVCDARLMGADCVLLIASALSDSELREFHGLTLELGMDALVETYDEDEVNRALAAGATMIGVNQRDLFTFEVDQERAVRVGSAIPSGIVRVPESGVRNRADAQVLADAGYDAVLVGEALVTSIDPAAAIHDMRGVGE